MEAKQKNTFYLLWTLAIFLCAALAFFVLFYSFFAKSSDSRDIPAPQTISTETTESY